MSPENLFGPGAPRQPYPGPLALYLHFPFCTRHCHYCDFYKVRFREDLVERYIRAAIYEIEMVFSSFGIEPIEIASIYIGGGTPSLIPVNLLEKWLTRLRAYIQFLPDFEFTVEANPESLTSDSAHGLYDLGVNRLVIGVQSFSVSLLRQVGRRVNSRDIYQAFYNARSAGFENIGGDLIFGLPGQKIKKVKTDIDRLAALEPTHISFYQLTVEEGTRLAEKVADERVKLPDEDTLAEMYRVGAHMLMDKGFGRYEVSNFARGGYAGRHNWAYWRGHPYVGLGPAAHGYLNGIRYGNVRDLDLYLEMVEEGRSPQEFAESLTREQMLTETVMLSLRTAEGIDRHGLISRFGFAAEEIIDGPVTERYIRSGLLVNEGGFLRATDPGFLLIDKIIADLVSQV